MSLYKGLNFLVTGGAGFIGSHIVDALIEKGGHVTVIDNLSAGAKENLHPDAAFIKGDIKKQWPFFYLDGDFEAVFHEAACGMSDSFLDPPKAITVNCIGTYNALEFARHRKAKFIHASTGSVLKPPNPYSLTKLAAEMLCQYYRNEYGLPTTILRYHNVYGPRQIIREERGVVPIFIEQALNNAPLTIHGIGNQRRVFTYVTDVVEANLHAYETTANGTYNVAAPTEDYSILQLAHKIGELLTAKIDYRFGPRKVGDVDRVDVDISETVKALNWKPTVNLDEGLRRCIQWRKRLME